MKYFSALALLKFRRRANGFLNYRSHFPDKIKIPKSSAGQCGRAAVVEMGVMVLAVVAQTHFIPERSNT